MNETLLAAFNAELILRFDVSWKSYGPEITVHLGGLLADQSPSDEIKASGNTLAIASDLVVEQLVRLVQEAEGQANFNLKRLAPLLMEQSVIA